MASASCPSLCGKTGAAITPSSLYSTGKPQSEEIYTNTPCSSKYRTPGAPPYPPASHRIPTHENTCPSKPHEVTRHWPSLSNHISLIQQSQFQRRMHHPPPPPSSTTNVDINATFKVVIQATLAANAASIPENHTVTYLAPTLTQTAGGRSTHPRPSGNFFLKAWNGDLHSFPIFQTRIFAWFDRPSIAGIMNFTQNITGTEHQRSLICL